MTVKELIIDLLKAPMDAEIGLKDNQLYIYESCKENTNELDDDIESCDIYEKELMHMY